MSNVLERDKLNLFGIITAVVTLGHGQNVEFETKSNDWYRGPTELVHYFAYRGSSRRCKGAASHITHLVWL
jgi:hypothetical protein